MRPASISWDGGYSLLFACIATLVAGCAGPTTELVLAPHAVSRAAAPTSNVAASLNLTPIRVYLAPVQDLRLDSESMGKVANRAFVAHAVSQWIDTALHETVQKRWPISVDADGGDLVLQPSLRKCYISSIDVTKAAVVVVEVAFTHLGKAAGSRIYRGRHTSMNWWNSDAELTAALQAAFDDCLVQILGDIEARANMLTANRVAQVNKGE